MTPKINVWIKAPKSYPTDGVYALYWKSGQITRITLAKINELVGVSVTHICYMGPVPEFEETS